MHTFDGTYADIDIRPDGQIWLYRTANVNTAFVSLEGVTYSQGADHGIPLSSNWTGIENTDSSHPSYGAADPGFSIDREGVVHLSGAVRQLNPESGVQQIGTVGEAPSSDVYTIVHTLGGTYADLTINTLGQIWLIPSSNTNTNFVSLEGVTYVASPPYRL